MTMNPLPASSGAQSASKAVRRFAYLHGEAVTLVLGIVLGFVMGKL